MRPGRKPLQRERPGLGLHGERSLGQPHLLQDRRILRRRALHPQRYQDLRAGRTNALHRRRQDAGLQRRGHGLVDRGFLPHRLHLRQREEQMRLRLLQAQGRFQLFERRPRAVGATNRATATAIRSPARPATPATRMSPKAVAPRVTVCTANADSCKDNSTIQTCNSDGSAYLPGTKPCEAGAEGRRCIEGKCAGPCEIAKMTKSYIGCEYYAVTLPNSALDPVYKPTGNESEFAVGHLQHQRRLHQPTSPSPTPAAASPKA